MASEKAASICKPGSWHRISAWRKMAAFSNKAYQR
jgi:hypothetical protein